MDRPEAPPASTARPSLLADWRTALLIFAAYRLILFGFDFLAGAMTLPNPVAQLHPDDPWQAFPDSRFLDGWARWDAGWYRSIVEHGYSVRRGKTSNVAFFPLYPLATKAVAAIVGNHWVAGLVVSNLATIGSLFYLLRIARPILGEDGVRRSLAYLLAFPTSFYLSAYYSEAIFLLTTSASFSYYLDRKPARCALWGFLATMARPTGVALFLAFATGSAWEIARGREKLRASLLWLALIPGGIVAFMAILYVQVGDPLAFVTAHGAWGRSSASPHVALYEAIAGSDWTFPRDLINAITLLDAVSAIAFLILPCFLFGRCHPALPIYALLLILVPLATGSVKSMMRLELVAFPTFFVLARFGSRPEVDRTIIFASALGLGLLNVLFANWFWVG